MRTLTLVSRVTLVTLVTLLTRLRRVPCTSVQLCSHEELTLKPYFFPFDFDNGHFALQLVFGIETTQSIIIIVWVGQLKSGLELSSKEANATGRINQEATPLSFQSIKPISPPQPNREAAFAVFCATGTVGKVPLTLLDDTVSDRATRRPTTTLSNLNTTLL